MNESARNQTATGSVLFIILLFVILTFFLFRFGGRQEVQNFDEVVTPEGATDEQAANIKFYQEYLNLKNSAGGDSALAEQQLSSKMQAEVDIPEPDISLQKVGIYDSEEYLNSFERIWVDKYNKGILGANNIFVSQAESPVFLVLSNSDREVILDSANLYDSFAQEISKINTPTNYKFKSEEAVKSAAKISYILKKVIEEKNEKIYTLWIAKYAKEMTNLNTARYVK